jgi:hypothetical protein
MLEGRSPSKTSYKHIWRLRLSLTLLISASGEFRRGEYGIKSPSLTYMPLSLVRERMSGGQVAEQYQVGSLSNENYVVK